MEGAAGHADALRPVPRSRTGAFRAVAGVRGSLRRSNASRARLPEALTSSEAGRTDDGNAANGHNAAATVGKAREHEPGAVPSSGGRALRRAADQVRGEAW